MPKVSVSFLSPLPPVPLSCFSSGNITSPAGKCLILLPHVQPCPARFWGRWTPVSGRLWFEAVAWGGRPCCLLFCCKSHLCLWVASCRLRGEGVVCFLLSGLVSCSRHLPPGGRCMGKFACFLEQMTFRAQL